MREGEFRDQLAGERTHLANERTVLAYARTALALAAGGAALLQFFADSLWLFWIAWSLVLSGAALLLFGAYRFIKVRRDLNHGLSGKQG